MCVTVDSTTKIVSLAATTTKGFNESKCTKKFYENKAWLCHNSYTSKATGYTTLAYVCVFDSCNSTTGSAADKDLKYTPQSWASKQAKCDTFTPSLYRCEHGGLGNCDATDCYHKTTTSGKTNYTWTLQDADSNMATRCGTDCGLTFTTGTGATAGENTVKAATVDNSNWNAQTQCVPPTNDDDQCQWLGKNCDFAMCQKKGAGFSNFAHKDLDSVNSDWKTAHPHTADVTHAEWADYWWSVRCNWTTEWEHQVKQVTTIADWHKYVKSNSASAASYKAKVAALDKIAADKRTTAQKNDLASDKQHHGKYHYFVSQDDTLTPSETQPHAGHADWDTWHAGSLKAATTKAEVDALRSDDNDRLTDANKWEKTNCADATGKKVPADPALCTASKDRVAQVQNWIDLDDAKLLKLAKAYTAPAVAKTAKHSAVAEENKSDKAKLAKL